MISRLFTYDVRTEEAHLNDRTAPSLLAEAMDWPEDDQSTATICLAANGVGREIRRLYVLPDRRSFSKNSGCLAQAIRAGRSAAGSSEK